MELREAVKIAKVLVDQSEATAQIGKALELLSGGDKKIEHLIKRQEGLEKAIEDRKRELNETDTEVTDKIASLNAKLKASELSAGNESKALMDQINDRKREYAEILSGHLIAIKAETSRLMADRKRVVDDLDNTITSKKNRLDAIVSELDKVMAKLS